MHLWALDDGPFRGRLRGLHVREISVACVSREGRLMDTWKENAKAWRELYRRTTMEHEIGHTAETVKVESQFRRLAEDDAGKDD